MTVARFLEQACDVLAQSGRLYRLGNRVAWEDVSKRPLLTVGIGVDPEGRAAAVLSRVLVGGTERGDEAPLAGNLVKALFASEQFAAATPQIEVYSTRPTFDRTFRLCQPGWNPEAKILMHADAVEPIVDWEIDQTVSAGNLGPALGRLLPRLRALLEEFCFESPADLVNAVAVLVTGLLINHFVGDSHPMVGVDGNRPGVGKTLFAQVCGVILDGRPPSPIRIGTEDELEKKLCALLIRNEGSVILLDNVKRRVSSEVIEMNALAPRLTFRKLGGSVLVSGPNTYLWVVTANGAEASDDTLDRMVWVRLRHDGPPRGRRFARDPVRYATDHRHELLAELVGLVQRWVNGGCRPGDHAHRCREWARTVGGIRTSAGLGGWFLADRADADGERSESVQRLRAVVDVVLRIPRPDLYTLAASRPAVGERASAWAEIPLIVDLLPQHVRPQAVHARASFVGKKFAALVGELVPVTVNNMPGTAVLRCVEVRSNTRLYHLDISLAAAPVVPPAPPPNAA